MSVKKSWKTFGRNVGKAFTNFGKSMATTARVVVGTEDRVNEEGRSTLKTSWTATGKGFGEAGKSLGSAAKATVSRPFEGAEEPTEAAPEEIVDVEVVDPTPSDGNPS